MLTRKDTSPSRPCRRNSPAERAKELHTLLSRYFQECGDERRPLWKAIDLLRAFSATTLDLKFKTAVVDELEHEVKNNRPRVADHSEISI